MKKNKKNLIKILGVLLGIIALSIVLKISSSYALNTTNDYSKNVYNTGNNKSIELLFGTKNTNSDGTISIEPIKVENNTGSKYSNKMNDLIFHFITTNSTKGRKFILKLTDKSGNVTKKTDDGKGSNIIGYQDYDDNYTFQVIFNDFNSETLDSIVMENLPYDNMDIYAWVEYKGEKYYPLDMREYTPDNTSTATLQTNKSLKKSTNNSLIPKQSTYTQQQINALKEEDVSHLKNKWANYLRIDVKNVDNYVDLYNYKGLGRLHKDGQKIKNDSNEEVNLKSVGLFHLDDYGYMYNEESLSSLKYWGINTIRIPAYVNYRISNGSDVVTRAERGLDTAYIENIEEMDRIIDVATELGYYCMVDVHILGGDGNILNYTEDSINFFTHFAEKYGNQNNIIYEFANEPYSSENNYEILTENAKTMSNLVKKIFKEKQGTNYKYDPIMITGDLYKNISTLVDFNNLLQQAGVNDVFISRHKYGNDNIDAAKAVYNAGVPILYTEWGNTNGDTNDFESIYTENSLSYLKWWSENNIFNSSWMLEHGNYTYSFWKWQGIYDKVISNRNNNIKNNYQQDLVNMGKLYENGLISDGKDTLEEITTNDEYKKVEEKATDKIDSNYLSTYGQMVFSAYLKDTLERVKANNINSAQNITVKLTTDNKNPKVGEKISLTAATNGGSGSFEYKFLVNNTDSNSWAVIQDYSEKSSISWELISEGNRKVYVDVKDKVTNIVTRSEALDIVTTTTIPEIPEGSIIDVIVFTGQSNMVGRSTDTYYENISKNSAWELKWNGKSPAYYLYDFSSTYAYSRVGDDIYNSSNEKILERTSGSSLTQAFLKKYIEGTNHKVIFVHAARGGEKISTFTKESKTERLKYIEEKTNYAISEAEKYAKMTNSKIGNKFYVMLQGETDAKYETSILEYKNDFLKFHNDIIDNCKLDFGTIITPGYNLIENARYTEKALDNIVLSQLTLSTENNNIKLLTTDSTRYYTRNADTMLEDKLHLNSIGLQNLGHDAANGLLKTGVILNKIELKKLPSKLKYLQNKDIIDLSDAELKLNYSDDSEYEVNQKNLSLKVLNYDNSKLGEQNITIEYGNNKIDFKIEVIEDNIVNQIVQVSDTLMNKKILPIAIGIIILISAAGVMVYAMYIKKVS